MTAARFLAHSWWISSAMSRQTSSGRLGQYGTFRKLGYLILGSLLHKDPTIKGSILGSPIFGNPPPHIRDCLRFRIRCLGIRLMMDDLIPKPNQESQALNLEPRILNPGPVS